MNILILGGGAREHALAWAIRQNPKCDRLITAPGNAGIGEIAERAVLDILDGDAVATIARDHAIDLVIIGPEAPLAAGVSDILRDMGIAVFGPSQAAARLETSKSFTKAICDAAGVPTAGWARFDNAADARAYITTKGLPLVIKADGLAAGKGVVIPETLDQALDDVKAMFGGVFGVAGSEVVIEEFMEGEEASLFVLCDGTTALPIGSAQDHKRAFDGDRGPNTGGMGAYSPAPVLTPEIESQVMAQIIHPTLAELARRGTPYQGVLYAGLMIDKGRARLVEYNARFGDPEAQVLMLRLGAQALDLIEATASGRLGEMRVNWADDHALCVVMATRGYPGPHENGSEIRGLDRLPGDSSSVVFHAATRRDGARITAQGGRVLSICARAQSLQGAHDRAYALARQIDWPEGYFRHDIGWRALR